MKIQVTTLADNGKLDDMFASEAALSLLIQVDQLKILFDTGATAAFMDNAEMLNLDLSKLDYVILSHAHSDHSGGLRCLCHNTRRKFELVLNPHFFNKKFKKEKDYLVYIGNDFSEEFLQVENIKTTFPLTDTFSLASGVHLLSNIEQVSELEPRDPRFVVLRAGQYQLDQFDDEQILVIDTPKGLLVLTGCAHGGIINICESVRRRFDKPIYALMGGLHLKDSDMDRIQKTASYFKEIGIQYLGACHCTGEAALAYLAMEGPEFIEMKSGSVHVFDLEG